MRGKKSERNKRLKNQPDYAENYVENQSEYDDKVYNSHLNTPPPVYDPTL